MLRFIAHRAMRGAASISPTNYGTVSLYNNGHGEDILAVWMITNNSGGAGGAVSFQQGMVGSVAGTVSSVVTGDAPNYGVIYTLDSAAAFTNYIGLTDGYATVDGLPLAKFPSYFLQPNWSLCVQALTANVLEQAAFLWQVVHRQDIMGVPCPVCDVTIAVVT